MTDSSSAWHAIANAAEIASPALILYPDRIEENIRRMISLTGDLQRLRPHIKTHKLREVIHLQRAQGITKFKCATIAEAEMAATCGAADMLLAYQPVGPNIPRMVELTQRFPATRFSALVDSVEVARELSKAFSEAHATLGVMLDLDCGMHRTGIAPSPAAATLYQLICQLPGLSALGLHAYDGHIHDPDLATRTARCEQAFAPVAEFRALLVKQGLPVPTVVAGGTPTFPMHARRPDVECSPGTCLLWDAGYGTKMPDLDFLCAALVLTRVVSKPGAQRLCLDLGHKAVASENPHPRVTFPELPDAQAVTHSEEHLVVETARAAEYSVGDGLYGIPWHICPTVALHSEAVVVKNGHARERWEIVGRRRRLTV